MTKNRKLLRGLAGTWPLLAGLISLHAQTAPAPADAPPVTTSTTTTTTTPAPTAPAASTEEIVKMPAFSVEEQQGDPYNATEVTSVARIAGNLIDQPFTVNVVPKELMTDLGANVSFDTTRYFAGISAGRGAGEGGIMDRQDFRGFESFSKTVDNFSSFLIPTGAGYQANFDPAFIERSELVMGPDAILSPTGSPGGSINVITKSPQFAAASSITLEAGNFDAQKVVFDSTGPITPQLAYRVIASTQDTDTYVPGRVVQTNGSIQLAYALSSTSKLTFKWFGEDWSVYGAAADPNDNGEIVGVTSGAIGGVSLSDNALPGFRWNGWNGDTRWSARHDRLNIGELEYTGSIGDLVSVRLAASTLYDHFTQDAGYPNVSPGFTYNQAGQATGITDSSGTSSNPANLTELANYTVQVNYEEQLQNDYAANFKTGGVSIQPVVGWAYQQGSQPTNKTMQDKNNTALNAGTMPNANLLAGDDYDPLHPAFADYNSSYSEQVEHAWLGEGYALMKLGFLDDRILLSGGVSRTWANDQVYTDSTVGTTITSLAAAGVVTHANPTGTTTANGINLNNFQNTGSALSPTQGTFQDNVMEGILVKPLPTLSVYGSYSTNAGIAGNTPVLWQTGRQYEFGVKESFFNQNLTLSADHFQISEANVSTVNPAHNTDATQPASLLANLNNQGYEFSAMGALTRNLSVIGSLTEMNLRQANGQKYKNVPDNMANLLLSYHFRDGALEGLSVFAGVNHTGTVTINPGAGATGGAIGQPAFYLAPYTIVNAGATYAWGRRYLLTLNLDNVLDNKYFWDAASTASISPGAGTGVRMSMTIKL
jgi:iron complex outermembrane receptor protein